MARKLTVAGAIALILAGVLGFLLLEEDGPRTIDSASDESAIASRSDSIAPSDIPDSDEETPSEESDVIAASELDLGLGAGGLHGVVKAPDGSVAPGSTVTLYRSGLPVEVEEEGGLSIFRIIEFSGWGTRAMRDLANADSLPFRPEIKRGLNRVAAVTADESGQYRFLGIGGGRYLLAAETAGTLETPTPSIQYVAEADTRVDIALIEAGDLTGTVLSVDGTPIPGASIKLRGEIVSFEGGMESTFVGRDELLLYLLNPVMGRAQSDALGGFRFTGLPPLPYQVFVEASPWAATEERHAVPEPGPVEIVLENGGALEGSVTDLDGRPVEGAEIALSVDGAGMWNAGGMPPMPETVTDGDGRFRFAGLAAETYTIDASAPRYRPARAAGLQVTRGETRNVAIEVEPGSVIEGVVSDPDGSPLPDVAVTARTGGRRGPNASTKTDRTGAFIIDTLAEGTYTVEFRREGWLGSDLETPTGEAALAVTMEPGPMVTARVVDTEGRPVARARIQSERDWTQRVRAETDGEGIFSLRLSREDESTLRVRATGFAAASVEVPAGGGDLGDVVLAEAARIEGFVLDPEGLALSGARVVATREDGERGRGRFGGGRGNSAWTDGDGAFSIEVDEPVGEYRLAANFPLLLPNAEERVSLSGTGVSGVVLTLRWGASIFGTVIGPENVPVDGATIEVRRTGENARRRGGRRTSRSRGGGEYQVAGLEAGTFEIRVSASGFAQTIVPDIGLGEDEARRMELSLEAERRLIGVVIDEGGIPIDRARVSVREESGARRNSSADPEGAFVVDRLGRGALSVTAESSGFLRTRLNDIYADDGPLEIVLRTAYEIPGIVLDSGTGDPVPNARVRVRNAEDRNSGRGGRDEWSRSDEEGRFLVQNLDVGEYRLEVTATGFIATRVEDVVVPPRNAGEDIVVLLQPGVRVRGTIYNPVGRPLANARARAYRLPDDPDTPPSNTRGRRRAVSQARSDDDGVFSLQGIEEGRYEITFSHGEFLSRTEVVTARLDLAEPVLSISLERGAEITGRVYTPAGLLQEGGNVMLTGPLRRRAGVEDDGSFRIAGLPAGTYTVEFRAGRSRSEDDPRVTVTLEAQERRTVDLRR